MTKDTNSEFSSQTKNEVEAIKKDIQDILGRLSNIKGESVKALSDDYEQLLLKMYSLRDQMASSDTIQALDWHIQKYPIKSALYCFGAGILLLMVLKKLKC